MAWLTGWKRIARHINRCVDTAKTYHKRYGMPVHRDPGGAPVALPDQLDLWLLEFNRITSNRDIQDPSEFQPPGPKKKDTKK